jgi:molecular chaperone GrpE
VKEDEKVQDPDGQSTTETAYISDEQKAQDDQQESGEEVSPNPSADDRQAEEEPPNPTEEPSSLDEQKDANRLQKQIMELEVKLKEAEQKAEEYYQRFLRAQADFENFRRRTRKEMEEMQTYAPLSVIEQLLPVLDNFERAIAAGKTSDDREALQKGVEMVFKQMKQVLDQQGLVAIEAVGQPFDPHIHEAVMQVESEDHEPGYVVEELQKGYKLKDKVIRPAMVKVSQ